MKSVLALLAVAAPAAANPLDGEYVVPAERERGTAYGQVRAWGGLGARSSDGTSFDAEGSFELMTFSTLGIRASSALTLVQAGAPYSRWLIASVGPSLHVLPYRWFDISLYLEGGVVRAHDSSVHYAPALSPGFTLEVWISPSWFVRYDGQLSWAVLGSSMLPETSWLGCLGLGVGI